MVDLNQAIRNDPITLTFSCIVFYPGLIIWIRNLFHVDKIGNWFYLKWIL